MDNILSERLRWLAHVIGMDHQRILRQALHWEVLEFKRGTGRPRTNWRSTVNKDLLRMGITWRKKRCRSSGTSSSSRCQSSHQNGVGVWPNAFTLMPVKSRSMLQHNYSSTRPQSTKLFSPVKAKIHYISFPSSKSATS